MTSSHEIEKQRKKRRYKKRGGVKSKKVRHRALNKEGGETYLRKHACRVTERREKETEGDRKKEDKTVNVCLVSS